MQKKLKAKILDVLEGRLEVVMNEEDARDMGLHPNDRVNISVGRKSAVAIVNTTRTLVEKGELGVTRDVYVLCPVKHHGIVRVSPGERPKSVEFIRRKMKGIALSEGEYEAIVKDVMAGNLSDIELTAFVSALYINKMSMDEMVFFTRKIAERGEMLKLKKKPIFDKHSIGGVPGNKITLLIVPIVAAAGLAIPKTSSRAVTSACGTADIMEVLAPVSFSASQVRGMMKKTNGVIVWGGSVNLAPADDIFISVEYPLSIDAHNLAICSVMAKKYAVGADFVVIDLPMGEGTKVSTMEEAKAYANDFMELGKRIGISVECVITYGDKPIGRAVGPALEAREALRALESEGPSSLIEKSTDIAGILLEAGGIARKGRGKDEAMKILKSGEALAKMREIIAVQGGSPKITSEQINPGEYRMKIRSGSGGYVTHIANRSIVKIARAAGSPKDKGAGALLHVSKGMKVKKGDVLFEIFSESKYK
ncbi:MAG: AMP phosphorylase, partial [Candidatus Hydrothermarchaeaceae archaeon]